MASTKFGIGVRIALVGLLVVAGLAVALGNRLYTERRLPVENLKQIKTGMTEFQVRLAIGPPHRVLETERTYWGYDARSTRDFLIMRFTNGRVTETVLRENHKEPPPFEELDRFDSKAESKK